VIAHTPRDCVKILLLVNVHFIHILSNKLTAAVFPPTDVPAFRKCIFFGVASLSPFRALSVRIIFGLGAFRLHSFGGQPFLTVTVFTPTVIRAFS
jgi:hypothetical protein